MSVTKGCIIAAVALIAGSLAEKARADEAYICDGGRVAYVKPGELEAKKRADPCIARYFDVEPAAPRSRKQSVLPAPLPSTAIDSAGASREAPPSSTQTSPLHAAIQPTVSIEQRKVRIINASPDTDGWFQLNR